MKREKVVKTGTFKCRCGCGQSFIATYTTRAPQYVDKKHRNRILAARKAAKREAWSKELWAKRRARQKLLYAMLREHMLKWPDGTRPTLRELKLIAEAYIPTKKEVAK